MKRIAVLVTIALACFSCSGPSAVPFGKDIEAIFLECGEGNLAGYDLKRIDISSLSEDFLASFKSRAGYDLKEVWPQVDTLADGGRFVPYILFDYRSAVIDLWRATYVPVAGEVKPTDKSQRLLLLYSDVDLARACAGDDSTAVNRSEKAAERLAEKNFDFDFVSDTTVRSGIKVRGGRVLSPCGTTYDALVVPGNSEMLPETLCSLLKLAKSGAAILFESDVPLNVPNLIAKGKVEGMEKELSELGLEPKNDMYYAKYGRGHVVVSNDIIIALLSMGLKMNN